MTDPAVAAGRLRAFSVVAGGLDPAIVDHEYAADRWRAERLGIDALPGRDTIVFDRICQPWLRDATKAWCRWRPVPGVNRRRA